jgi:2-iminoacetate synthase ThiH
VPAVTGDLLSTPLDVLCREAAARRDDRFGNRITFSPKVFIPLTMLCRDTCGYCTFAQPPARLDTRTWIRDQVVSIAKAGARGGLSRGAVHPWANGPS